MDTQENRPMPLVPNITEKNLVYYRHNSAAYVEETVKMDMSANLDQFLSYLQDGGHILDLGCGSGRDILFFIGHGYTVMAMDPAPEFAKLASLLLNQQVITQPAQSINEIEKYDGIH